MLGRLCVQALRLALQRGRTAATAVAGLLRQLPNIIVCRVSGISAVVAAVSKQSTHFCMLIVVLQ